MSLQRAMKAMSGIPTDRVAQMEFLSHAGFFRQVTGLDPYTQTFEAFLAFLEYFDVDATLIADLGPPSLRDGQTRNDQHLTYAAWGLRETAWVRDPLFKTPDEILALDPAVFDKRSLQQKIDSFCADYERQRAAFGGRALLVPGQYQLVLHYATSWCDWAIFLELLALDVDKCRPLFDRCMNYTIEIFQAFAASSAPIIIAHEDLCSARGPIFSPDFLRREVFPRFAQIYEPVKKVGKKVLAVSDGLIEPIAADLVAAGADGLFIEPMNDIDRMIGVVGAKGILVGGGNTRTLTVGTPEQVQAEVRANMQKAKHLPGFFFCLAGEAPDNVPLENLHAYFDACKRYGTNDKECACD